MFDIVEEKPHTEKKPKDWFIREVTKRIASGRNFIGIIHGPTGSGKSYLGMKIAEKLDPTFNIERVIFDPEDFFDLIGKLPKGAWLVFDEAGAILDARRFMTVVNCVVSYVLETFRYKQISVIFTVPNLKMIDTNVRRLMHAMVFQRDRGKARIYRVDTGYDGTVYAFRIGRFKHVQKPSDQLVEAYEAKKAKAFKQILVKARVAISSSGQMAIPLTEEERGDASRMQREMDEMFS